MVISHWRLEIDGIDRCGKDSVIEYMQKKINHNFYIMNRGLISTIAYSKIFGRDNFYPHKIDESSLIAYIYIDEISWKERMEKTNHPFIDYSKHANEFEQTYQNLLSKNQKKIKKFIASNSKSIEHLAEEILLWYYSIENNYD